MTIPMYVSVFNSCLGEAIIYENKWIRDKTRIFFSYTTLKLIHTHKALTNQNFLLLKIIKQSMLTMYPLIKIIENQLMIILATVTSVKKSLVMNYLIKLQMILAKTIARLIRSTRITLIALTTQEQSNIMIAEMTKIKKMCENH